MSLSHEELEPQLRAFAAHHLGKLFVAGFVVFNTIGFQIGYNNNGSLVNAKSIERLEASVREASTYQILAEKRWSTLAENQEKAGNTELADAIRSIIKELEGTRIKPKEK